MVDPESRLTKNFRLGEVCVSSDCPDLAAAIVLTDYEVQVAKLLAESLLQPLRDTFGPINVLSWKRSLELNQAIGGSEQSDHLYASAADIQCWSAPPQRFFDWFLGHHALTSEQRPYRQVILYSAECFIHASINIPGRPFKHEALRYEDGVYRLVPVGQCT